MRKFSLVFAASLVLGLVASANAEIGEGIFVGGKQAHKIMAEGEILHTTDRPNVTPYQHMFTVRYDGQIYACNVKFMQQRNIVVCYTNKID